MIDYSKLAFSKPIKKEKKNKPIKKISDKRKERLKNWWWEKQIMRAKLINSQDNWFLSCDVCWKKFSIESAWPYCLPHILSKKNFPHLRNFINNLWCVCSITCHQEFDKIIAWNNKQEIEQKILNWETILINNYK